MKIYLGGSIAAGREFAGSLKLIYDILLKLDHTVITPFVVDEELNKKRFPGLQGEDRAKAIFKEDLELLQKSDAAIFEISQPSHGVGVEIGFLTASVTLVNKKKPVLLLRHKSVKNQRPSALLFGDPYIIFKNYDYDNLEEIVKEFLTLNK